MPAASMIFWINPFWDHIDGSMRHLFELDTQKSREASFTSQLKSSLLQSLNHLVDILLPL